VNNNPVNAIDPTGHQCVGEPEECLEDDGTAGGGFPGTGGTVSNPGAGDCSGSGCHGEGGSSDQGTENQCPAGNPNCRPSINDLTNPNTAPCLQLFSSATCQGVSGFLSVGALTLDTVAATGSGIFSILELVALLGGPIGLGAVEAAYLIANAAEGWLGAASLALTLTNDFLFTGGSYIALGSNPEVVLSSDVVISGVFAFAGGADPEPFGDSVMNGTAVIYDIYRMSGGDTFFELHIGVSGWYLRD
jgi:hypothetical protein